jgi:hypothetical protein
LARLLCVGALLVLWSPALVREAASHELPLDAQDWQGLGQWIERVGTEGIMLVPSDTLGHRVPAGGVLVWMHPPEDVPVDDLLAWIASGGRLLWVAERDSGCVPLRAMGLRCVIHAPAHDMFWDEMPDLPVLRPGGMHELAAGIRQLVANRPAAFSGPGRPVFPFADGAGLVWDLRLQHGRVVVVGDVSLFINLMQPAGDNAVATAMWVRRLCSGTEPCTVLLAQGDVPLRWPDDSAPMASAWSWPEIRATGVDALARLRRVTLEPWSLRLLAWVLLVALLMVIAVWMPVWWSARWSEPGRPRVWSLSAFSEELHRYEGLGAERAWTRPALLLRQQRLPGLLMRMADRGVCAQPWERLDARTWVRAWQRWQSRNVPPDLRVSRRELRWIHDTLRYLPAATGHSASATPLTAADFSRLARGLQRLEHLLEPRSSPRDPS